MHKKALRRRGRDLRRANHEGVPSLRFIMLDRLRQLNSHFGGLARFRSVAGRKNEEWHRGCGRKTSMPKVTTTFKGRGRPAAIPSMLKRGQDVTRASTRIGQMLAKASETDGRPQERKTGTTGNAQGRWYPKAREGEVVDWEARWRRRILANRGV